jgi:hypothetical protein
MSQPAHSTEGGGSNFQKKLEAAIILRGLVRLRLDEGELEVEPQSWYRESGEHYLEARRRDSGEHVRLRVSDIRDVTAY